MNATVTPMPTRTPAIAPTDHRQEIVDRVLGRVNAQFAVKAAYAEGIVTRLDAVLAQAQRLVRRNEEALEAGR